MRPNYHLGLPWKYSVDLFGAGCVLAELYLGRILFPSTQTDMERLALLERVIGSFPLAFAKRGERSLPGTFSFGIPVRVRYQPNSEQCESARRLLEAVPLSVTVSSTSSAPTSAPSGTAPHYGQCGGIGWTGPTVCEAGYTCTVSNRRFCR